MEDWKETSLRFVAFFDILGFKELVAKSKHEDFLDKLKSITSQVKSFKDIESAKLGIGKEQVMSITFSDSFVFISKGDDKGDATKIIFDSLKMIELAETFNMSIRGALSYGVVSVDRTNNIFFGQPIVDAFVLHEELQILTVISDEKFEAKIKTFEKNESEVALINLFSWYKANLKNGNAYHYLLKPYRKQSEIDKRIASVTLLYNNVSGRARLYIDNTLQFLESIKK